MLSLARLEIGEMSKGKGISDVQFQTKREENLWRETTTSAWFFQKVSDPFDFQNLLIFRLIGKHRLF